MTRWIAATAGALALTFAFALAVPFGNNAAADGVERPVYRAVYKHKRCIVPARSWGMSWWSKGPTSWVCNADETCCYDRLLRKGSCLPASQRCF
jgi:hypothetical protein